MAVSEAGISTIGVLFAYAVEISPGAQPSNETFKVLERCNSIGGISLSTEQIDASALEDGITRYIAGRQDTGGTWSVTFNLTTEVEAQLDEMIKAYKALKGGNRMWFEVYTPKMSKAFFVVAQPPENIPLPETSQNGLWTVEMSITVEEYKGMLEVTKAPGVGE